MHTLMIYGATGTPGAWPPNMPQPPDSTPCRNQGTLAALAADWTSITALSAWTTLRQSIKPCRTSAFCSITPCPFARTAEPFMTAAIRLGTHYLDIAAELDSYHLAEILDQQAAAAGVMLLPGSGGSVAMLGCLAAHASRRIEGDIDRISIALHVAGSMFRGSAISATANLTIQCLRRSGGELVDQNPQHTRAFEFGNGPTDCYPATLPDLVALWRSTQAADIETYVHVSGDAFPDGDLAALPEGPTAEQRHANRYQASVEVVGAGGQVARAVLDTVNRYTFTPMAAIEAARRVLAANTVPDANARRCFRISIRRDYCRHPDRRLAGDRSRQQDLTSASPVPHRAAGEYRHDSRNCSPGSLSSKLNDTVSSSGSWSDLQRSGHVRYRDTTMPPAHSPQHAVGRSCRPAAAH